MVMSVISDKHKIFQIMEPPDKNNVGVNPLLRDLAYYALMNVLGKPRFAAFQGTTENRRRGAFALDAVSTIWWKSGPRTVKCPACKSARLPTRIRDESRWITAMPGTWET